MNYIKLYWKVESGCNMGCEMCLRKHNTKVLKGYEQKLLSQAKAIGFSTIVLTGGEPTLRADLPKLIQECSSQGFNVRLDTNGTHLNRRYLTVLKKHLYILGLPLHGSNAQLHDSIVRRPGHFNVIRDRSKLARELGIPIKITTATSRKNLADIQNIAQYLAGEIHPQIYGVNSIAKGSLSQEDYESLKITSDEFDHVKDNLKKGNYPFQLSFCFSNRDSAGAYVFINPDFTISIPSLDSEEIVGDLKKESLEAILARASINQEQHVVRSKETSL